MEKLIFNLTNFPESDELRSLADFRNKFYLKKDEQRASMSHEEKYDPKVLVGNWVERRVDCAPSVWNDWKTTYELDYRRHVIALGKCGRIEARNNKLKFEGLPKEILIDHNDASEHNWLTTYQNEYTRDKVVKP